MGMRADPAGASAAPPGAWRLFCDGSAPPRSTRMGLGAVAYPPAGAAPVQLSEALQCPRGAGGGCSNEAELHALAMALRWLQAHLAQPAAAALVVHSDSRVLTDQLGGASASTPPTEGIGARAAPIARLAPLVDAVRAQLACFGSVQLHWIARHRNGEADALARAALGLAPKPATVPHPRAQRRGRRAKAPRNAARPAAPGAPQPGPEIPPPPR